MAAGRRCSGIYILKYIAAVYMYMFTRVLYILLYYILLYYVIYYYKHTHTHTHIFIYYIGYNIMSRLRVYYTSFDM
jgi:hypothetical protein